MLLTPVDHLLFFQDEARDSYLEDRYRIVFDLKSTKQNVMCIRFLQNFKMFQFHCNFNRMILIFISSYSEFSFTENHDYEDKLHTLFQIFNELLSLNRYFHCFFFFVLIRKRQLRVIVISLLKVSVNFN